MLDLRYVLKRKPRNESTMQFEKFPNLNYAKKSFNIGKDGYRKHFFCNKHHLHKHFAISHNKRLIDITDREGNLVRISDKTPLLFGLSSWDVSYSAVVGPCVVG